MWETQRKIVALKLGFKLLTKCDVIDDFENNLSASLNFLCFLSSLVAVLLYSLKIKLYDETKISL